MFVPSQLCKFALFIMRTVACRATDRSSPCGSVLLQCVQIWNNYKQWAISVDHPSMHLVMPSPGSLICVQTCNMHEAAHDLLCATVTDKTSVSSSWSSFTAHEDAVFSALFCQSKMHKASGLSAPFPLSSFFANEMDLFTPPGMQMRVFFGAGP